MPDLRSRRYTLLFSVQRSQRYHSRRRRHFDRLHKAITVITLVSGSGAFLAWMVDLGVAVGTLSALVAILSAIELVAGTSARARDHHEFERRWVELEQEIQKAGDYDEAKYADLNTRRLSIIADEAPVLRVLDVLCHNELIRALGREGQGYDWQVGPIQRICAQWFDWRPDSISPKPAGQH